MKDISIIIPVNNIKKFKKYILININFFIKYNIYIHVVSSRKITFIEKNKFIKITANKKFKNHMDKIFYALKTIKTKYVFFLREDDLLCGHGFLHLYNEIKKDDKISSIQGTKYLAVNKNYKKIHPHNPNNFNFQPSFEKLEIKEKFKNVLNYGPECYWTLHKTKIVKKFYSLVIKKKHFGDFENYYDLSNQYFDFYFIFFLLIYGDVKFENIPINLRIKFKRRIKFEKIKLMEKFYPVETAKKNIFFLRNLQMLSNLINKNRNIKKIDAEKIILYALNKKAKLPKPRDILENYNYFHKGIHVIKKIYKKINEFFCKSHLISRNDIYYVTSLKRNLHKKLINNVEITKELNYLFKKIINPNKY